MGYSFLVDSLIVDARYGPYSIEVWVDVDYERAERGYDWTPATPEYFNITDLTFTSDMSIESPEVEVLLENLNEIPLPSKLVLYQIIFDVTNPYEKIKRDFKLKLETNDI